MDALGMAHATMERALVISSMLAKTARFMKGISWHAREIALRVALA